LKKLQSAIDLKKISLCFGSKHLFQQQFHLQENGYQNHEEWLAKWQFARNNSFFLIGSKDESQGNQSCVATVEEDKRLTLRIRLPNVLGKYLLIPHIEFGYGHDRILHALQEGKAISYRFFRDEKGLASVCKPLCCPRAFNHIFCAGSDRSRYQCEPSGTC
jgi:hypothetical protein